MGRPFTDADAARARELHSAGLSDAGIARTIGRERGIVSRWRRREGLPINGAAPLGLRPLSDESVRARLALYRAGRTDRQIAEIEGVHRTAIAHWRRKLDLPSNEPDAASRGAIWRQRMVFYALGWGDRHIAREMGVSREVVRDWRKKKGLPANFNSHCHESRLPARPTIADLVSRVRRAIGRALPRDIAEDAVADMLAAIMEGALRLDDIEREARRCGNRVLDRFASRFGPRSLDATIGEDDFTLMDTLADERSSDWLEEMGATVW